MSGRGMSRIVMRTAAQKRCPADFMRRILAAHATSPFPIGYSHAMIGACDCVPDITLCMPDGALVEIDAVGRCRKETRQ